LEAAVFGGKQNPAGVVAGAGAFYWDFQSIPWDCPVFVTYSEQRQFRPRLGLSRRNPSRSRRRSAGRALPTYLDRFHVAVCFSPSFKFPVANNRRGRRSGSLLHNAAMFCARILDDPEIGQCGGRERSNDNDSSCQKLRFHRFLLSVPVYSSPLSVIAVRSLSSRNLRSAVSSGPGQFPPAARELSISLVVFEAEMPETFGILPARRRS
jgi:hypothetical protein